MAAKDEEVKKFYLSALELLKQGKAPVDICKILNISKQRLNYYLRGLKANGYVQKVGYGVWEVKKMPGKEVKILGGVGSRCPTKEVKKEIRGHAYQFTLKIPKLSNWHRREEYLKKHNIQFSYMANNKSHKIVFNGHKVWLTPISIVVYFPEGKSYFTDMARDAHSYAVYDFIQLIIGLENLLNVSFKIRDEYLFRTCRQHYSILHNAIARQYNREGKKLYVRDHKGYWLSVDFSFHKDELETFRHETAISDNEIVQRDFNELKEMNMTRKDMKDEYEQKVMKLMEIMKLNAEQTNIILNIMGLNAQPIDDGDNKKLQNYFG